MSVLRKYLQKEVLDMSLMSDLYVGHSGLTTSQNALNTTGNNLANIQTKGYTRQQVVQSDAIYNSLGLSATTANQVGSGVTIAVTPEPT